MPGFIYNFQLSAPFGWDLTKLDVFHAMGVRQIQLIGGRRNFLADFGMGFTGLALASVVATVTGLVAAVALYRMTWARGGPSSDAFTAMGLVILAVAEIQYALWPSVYTGLVTISDMMRLVAYTVLIAGLIADQRSDLRALRSAYSVSRALALRWACSVFFRSFSSRWDYSTRSMKA